MDITIGRFESTSTSSASRSSYQLPSKYAKQVDKERRYGWVWLIPDGYASGIAFGVLVGE